MPLLSFPFLSSYLSFQQSLLPNSFSYRLYNNYIIYQGQQVFIVLDVGLGAFHEIEHEKEDPSSPERSPQVQSIAFR